MSLVTIEVNDLSADIAEFMIKDRYNAMKKTPYVYDETNNLNVFSKEACEDLLILENTIKEFILLNHVIDGNAR